MTITLWPPFSFKRICETEAHLDGAVKLVLGLHSLARGLEGVAAKAQLLARDVGDLPSRDFKGSDSRSKNFGFGS